jgi:hypothetical protein
MKRICSRCGEEKDISEFSPSYKTKDGTQKYDSTCKECYRKIDKKRRKEDPIYRERKIASSRKSYQNNREKRLEEKKEYHIKNREVILEKKRIYRQDPKQKEYRRIWMKNYFNNNKDKYQLYRDKTKYIAIWRQLLRDIFIDANKRKQKYIIEQLGYNTIELHNHLESLFKEGMTWDNYGEWEIDHKKPLSAFDKDALPSEVNALSNLQPLWKIENQQKYNHWDGEFENEMNNISDEMIDEMIDGLSDEELNDFDNELDNKNNINKN